MRCSECKAYCIQRSEEAVFCPAHSNAKLTLRNRYRRWRDVVIGTSALIAVAIIALTYNHRTTKLVSSDAFSGRTELEHLHTKYADREHASNIPASYSELALIPAPSSQIESAKPNPDVAVLKRDFNSNLRLLSAAGGLDLKKIPQLGGSSQVVCVVLRI